MWLTRCFPVLGLLAIIPTKSETNSQLHGCLPRSCWFKVVRGRIQSYIEFVLGRDETELRLSSNPVFPLVAPKLAQVVIRPNLFSLVGSKVSRCGKIAPFLHTK